MRVLVTGGAGFLGAAFALRARAAGHAVTTLDRDGEADILCDVSEDRALASAVDRAAPAAIVHLAATLTDTGERDPVRATRVNALGTAAVFAAAEAAGAERVIYAGSIAAVGPCGPAGDHVALAPRSVYGATKAFGEHLARIMSERPGAPCYLTLRFGWVFGPGRARGWRDPQDLIARIAQGARRIRFPDYPDPIDWTWIDDATSVLEHALRCPLPRYAVCNALGDKRTIRDAMAHLQRRFPDLVAEPQPAATPPTGWALVNDGLLQIVGYVPPTRLEDAIDRLIASSQ